MPIASYLSIWSVRTMLQRPPSLFSSWLCLVRLLFTAEEHILTLVSFAPLQVSTLLSHSLILVSFASLQSPWFSVTQGPIFSSNSTHHSWWLRWHPYPSYKKGACTSWAQQGKHSYWYRRWRSCAATSASSTSPYTTMKVKVCMTEESTYLSRQHLWGRQTPHWNRNRCAVQPHMEINDWKPTW